MQIFLSCLLVSIPFICVGIVIFKTVDLMEKSLQERKKYLGKK